MAKEKKVETRDLVYEALAADLLARGAEKVVRYKEGLRVDQEDEVFIIRAVKKKVEPAEDEKVGEYFVGEDGKFTYKPLKEKQ